MSAQLTKKLPTPFETVSKMQLEIKKLLSVIFDVFILFLNQITNIYISVLPFNVISNSRRLVK